jgi:hypothetical protein
MKNITCTFSDKDTTRDLYPENVKLHSDMLAIVNGEVSDECAYDYAKALAGCIKDFGAEDCMFWTCVNDEHRSTMPSDARVEYIYKPTYMASCILAHVYLTNENVRRDEKFCYVLRRALNGCMGRHFTGHGMDAEEGFQETMQIFREGHMPDFTRKYPDFNISFTTALAVGLATEPKPGETSYFMTDEDV